MTKAGNEVEARAMKETGDTGTDHDTEIKREDHVIDQEIEIETDQEIGVEKDRDQKIDIENDQGIDIEKDQDQNTETNQMKDTETNQDEDQETEIEIVWKSTRKRKIQN